jgi:hypothetical protein
LLGPPLVTEQLKSERLAKPLALGVLSSDGLSSAAYGIEEILYALIPFFGLAAFTLVLPLTLLVLLGIALVVLSYREGVPRHLGTLQAEARDRRDDVSRAPRSSRLPADPHRVR